MKKKYLMILSLAAVSVVFGSLFYSNVTKAQRGREPSIHKDTIEINVMEMTERPFWIGTFFSENLSAMLPFAFTPRQTFQNVTDLWVTVVLSSPAETETKNLFNLTLNDEVELSTELFLLPLPNDFSKSVTTRVTDHNALKTLHEGINTIEISDPFKQSASNPNILVPYAIFMLKVTILVEYEYLA